jgi:hypothetical protein
VDPNELLERSVRFCLRGFGMTEESIERHYQPERLALLLAA